MTFFSRHKRSKALLMASTAVAIPFIIDIPQVEASNSTYDDFNSNAYWAVDMQWMIDEGLITGYINQKHRTTKMLGNWLDPNGALTEYQMLSVLLRFNMGIADYKDQSTAGANLNADFSSYWHYEKASKLGITTKGSTTNKSYANAQVTRGQLAQAIVSMHYGKDVTLEQAVDFMYANKLTTGTNPNVGQTLANFAPDTKLSRAHISAFLHRYENLKVSGNVVDTLSTGGTSSMISKPTESTVSSSKSVPTVAELNALTRFKQKTGTADVTGNKIKTKHGERAYGAKTQAEYDAILPYIAKSVSKDFGTAVLNMDRDALPREIYDNYKAGKRGITDKKNWDYYSPVNWAYLGMDMIHTLGVLPINSYEDVLTFSQISQLAQSLTSLGTHNVGLSSDTGGYGALELFQEGGSNCVTWSYAKQAFFDHLGLDSVVVHSPSQMHAYTSIYLNGVWVAFDGAMGPLELLKDDYISYAPNGGKDIMTKEMQAIYKPVN